MTPNWHLKSFSHQLKYIFKALESVLSFFFSLDIHLRGLCGFFLSETEVTTLCRKQFSAAWKGKVSFQITVGELTYLCQQEI